jgi:acetylornithine deacetylase
MDELVALTRELVATPSHEDPTAAGDRIEEWLRAETDATVERDPSGNVLARRGDGSRSLALVGHHDVVPPDDSQVAGDEYVVERRGGRLFGRGAADMKGAVAAALLAFRDCEPAADTELVVASFVGEEVGGAGCRAAIDRGFTPDYAVVGEGSTGYSAPGVTDVAVAHKGRRGSTIVAEGVASHASEPAAGENAIYRASEAVDRLRGLPTPSVAVAGESLSGTVVATEIDGGEAMNVVPERCEVTVDERTVPGERVPLGRLADADGVSVRVDQDLPPMRCDDADFREAVLAAARSVQEADGGDDGDDGVGGPQAVVKPHATDAGWLAGAGTEPVVCGPAEPGEAHTATESVSVAVLERCYRIYRGVAERFEA